MHLELEVNLLVRNVIEREIEEEKVQMKPPIVVVIHSILLTPLAPLVGALKILFE